MSSAAFFFFFFLLKIYKLTLNTLDKILSRRYFDVFFLFSTENGIWHFMQIVSILPNPVFLDK